MHTLDKPDDLESLVAKEDVIFLLLHSPQDSEILVSKLSSALLQVSSLIYLLISFRNSSLKHQHHFLVHLQSMLLHPPNFIPNFLFLLDRIGPSPFTKTTTLTYHHPHSTVLIESHSPISEHGSSHIVCQLLWS